MNTSTANLRCTRCGSTKFLPSSSGQLRDQDTLTCNGCKGQIKVGEARKQARQAVEKALADRLRRTFK